MWHLPRLPLWLPTSFFFCFIFSSFRCQFQRKRMWSIRPSVSEPQIDLLLLLSCFHGKCKRKKTKIKANKFCVMKTSTSLYCYDQRTANLIVDHRWYGAEAKALTAANRCYELQRALHYVMAKALSLFLFFPRTFWERQILTCTTYKGGPPPSRPSLVVVQC